MPTVYPPLELRRTRGPLDRLNDMTNVKDFGAVGDGIADDTTAITAAIASIASQGCLYFPPGVYLTTGILLPKYVEISVDGGGSATLKAAAGATAVLSVEYDISRGGHRFIRDITIDGDGVAGVIGIASGGPTAAVLYLGMQGVFIRGCYLGFSLYSAMEHSLYDCTAYQCTIGGLLCGDPTNGGGSANAFIRCAFQDCTVGFLYDANGNYPLHNNGFHSCVFQANTLCAFAAFDADSGIQINTSHFEANGTAGATLVVGARTIYKSCIYVSRCQISLVDCEISESAALCFKLANAARLKLTNCGGYGSTAGVYVEGTTAETVEFYGHHDLVGTVQCHVGRWPDTISVLQAAWMGCGEPVCTASPLVPNEYAASAPQTPLLQNGVGATINADAGDAAMGMVSNVTYLASVGSTGANRVTINALPTGVSNGDTWAVSFMVKASVATAVTFAITSGSYATFQACPVSTTWRRVVIVFKASAANTPIVYAFPTDAAGATVSFGRIQSLRVPTGGNLYSISEMVARGLFNGACNEYAYTAAPTVGTWKRGDRVWNSAPSAAGVPGWVCVAAGTPGTWKAMPVLAA